MAVRKDDVLTAITQDTLKENLFEAICTHNNQILNSLLCTQNRLPEICSLRYKLEVNDSVNILELAFVKGNTAAIFQLIEFCWQYYEFIKAPCLWLPEAVSIPLLNYYTFPYQETKLVLAKALRLYTTKAIIQKRMTQLAIQTKQIHRLSKQPLAAKIKQNFPKHYQYFPAHFGPTWLAHYKEHLEFFVDIKNEYIELMQEQYDCISKLEQKAIQDLQGFIEILYEQLRTIEFNLKCIANKITAKAEEGFYNGVDANSKVELQQELTEIFLVDRAFIQNLLADLYPCLMPEFVEHLNYSACSLVQGGEFKYKIMIVTKMQIYCKEIFDLLNDVLIKLETFNTGNQGNTLSAELAIESAMLLNQLLAFLDERRQFVLQHQQNGKMIPTQNTKDAFYIIYKYKQKALNIVERFLDVSLQTNVVLATDAAEVCPSKQIIATTELQPTQMLVPKIALQSSVQDKPVITLSNEPLTAAECAILQKAKLEQYRASIDAARKVRKMEKAEEKKLARAKIIQTITQKTGILNNFELEFKTFLQRADIVVPKLIAAVSRFLAADSTAVKHSEVMDLLQVLGFKYKETSAGFNYMYGRFSVSYHRGHEKKKGTFVVAAEAVDNIKKAINDSNVIQHLTCHQKN